MGEHTDHIGSNDKRPQRGNIPSSFPLWHRLMRFVWGLVWLTLFRPSPRPMHGWRRGLLKLFGAQIGYGSRVYPKARVWAPWNLVMGEYSCLSDDVDCYCVAKIHIGSRVTVSQYSYLCGATHDHKDPLMRLVAMPIVIHDWVWVCADVFVGPGVILGEGAVVGARSSVYKDVPSWKVCVGNPAAAVKDRQLRDRAELVDTAEGKKPPHVTGAP